MLYGLLHSRKTWQPWKHELHTDTFNILYLTLVKLAPLNSGNSPYLDIDIFFILSCQLWIQPKWKASEMKMFSSSMESCIFSSLFFPGRALKEMKIKAIKNMTGKRDRIVLTGAYSKLAGRKLAVWEMRREQDSILWISVLWSDFWNHVIIGWNVLHDKKWKEMSFFSFSYTNCLNCMLNNSLQTKSS